MLLLLLSLIAGSFDRTIVPKEEEVRYAVPNAAWDNVECVTSITSMRRNLNALITRNVFTYIIERPHRRSHTSAIAKYQYNRDDENGTGGGGGGEGGGGGGANDDWSIFVKFRNDNVYRHHPRRSATRRRIVDIELKYRVLDHTIREAVRTWFPFIRAIPLSAERAIDGTQPDLRVAVLPSRHVGCFYSFDNNTYAHAGWNFVHLHDKWHWHVRYEDLSHELRASVMRASERALDRSRLALDRELDIEIAPTLLHEIGHVFGLRHADDNADWIAAGKAASLITAHPTTDTSTTYNRRMIDRIIREIRFWRKIRNRFARVAHDPHALNKAINA